MSKFGNRRTEVDGITFASKREALDYQELKLRERAGEVRDIRLQVSYPLEVNGQRVCTYIADAVYQEIDARGVWREIVQDSKGYRTPAYRLKKKLLLALYGIDVREV